MWRLTVSARARAGCRPSHAAGSCDLDLAMFRALLLPFLAWAGKLRFPTLFKLAAGLFALNLLLPDPIPLLDEVLLGLGTLLLSQWKSRADKPSPTILIDGQPARPTKPSS